MTTRPLIVGALLSISASACGGGPWFGPTGPVCDPVIPYVEDTIGELGLGRFEWDCFSDADPTCGSNLWPSAVAVGSRFGLRFDASSSLPDGIGSGALKSASEPLLSGSGTGFYAEHPGTVSVIAPGHESVIDFVDLRLERVNRITLTRELVPAEDDPYCESLPPPPDEGDSADLYVGEEVEIQALPYHDSLRLGGELAYSFKSLDFDVIDIYLLGGRRARIEGIKVGTGRILVTAGDYEEIVEVEVTEAPEGWDSGGDDDGPPPHRNKPDGQTGSDSGSGGSDSGGSDSGGSDESGSGSDDGGTGGTG